MHMPYDKGDLGGFSATEYCGGGGRSVGALETYCIGTICMLPAWFLSFLMRKKAARIRISRAPAPIPE